MSIRKSPARSRAFVAGLLVVVLVACAATHTSSDSTRADPPDGVVVKAGDSTRVPVLVYHSIAHHHAGQTGEQRELDVDTAAFRAQMAYLASQHYYVISLGDLVDALQGKREVPANAVVITFDDGWKDQFEDALPILEKYNFTATFFVYTKAIGDGPAFMTWDDVRALQRAGMTIGAHSRTHPVLTKPDVVLSDEIEGSRADINREVGVAPDLFAYPYGTWDARVAAEVRAAGFRGARGMGDGPVNRMKDLFAIRSILVTDDMPAFESAVSGHPPASTESPASRSWRRPTPRSDSAVRR